MTEDERRQFAELLWQDESVRTMWKMWSRAFVLYGYLPPELRDPQAPDGLTDQLG